MKIGAVTIGQSPRVDVTSDIMDILGGNVELIQSGGLDGLTKEEIAEFAPAQGDYVLISRLTDGDSVTVAEKYIIQRIQEAINRLEAEGCKLIMMFCTGNFPEKLTAKNIPLIYPCEILERIVPLMSKKSSIICIIPSPLQVKQMEQKWKKYVKNVRAIPASPYGSSDSLEEAADIAKNIDADLVVMDCIGYTREMKEIFTRKSGKPVILPRTLLARVVSELIT